jgi:hypothetical protein
VQRKELSQGFDIQPEQKFVRGGQRRHRRCYWARDTSLDGTTNGSAGINSAPNVDAGINGATHLGGQRCGDHEDRGDSTNYRKLAEHKIVPQPGAIATTMAATNKCLAQSNKSAAGGKVTKKRSADQWVSTMH